MRILKFTLEPTGRIEDIEIGKDAKVVHVAEQHGQPTMWVADDGTNPVARQFLIVGTGHEIPHATIHYCGAAMCGPFVWHVLEVC